MKQIVSAADLGKLIRETRKRKGFTQMELADGADVGITFVSNLENGKETSEMGKAIRVAQMLGIDLFAEERTA